MVRAGGVWNCVRLSQSLVLVVSVAGGGGRAWAVCGIQREHSAVAVLLVDLSRVVCGAENEVTVSGACFDRGGVAEYAVVAGIDEVSVGASGIGVFRAAGNWRSGVQCWAVAHHEAAARSVHCAEHPGRGVDGGRGAVPVLGKQHCDFVADWRGGVAGGWGDGQRSRLPAIGIANWVAGGRAAGWVRLCAADDDARDYGRFGSGRGRDTWALRGCVLWERAGGGTEMETVFRWLARCADIECSFISRRVFGGGCGLGVLFWGLDGAGVCGDHAGFGCAEATAQVCSLAGAVWVDWRFDPLPGF